MATITEQIEEILDKRLGRGIYAGRGRLQKIESKIAALSSVKEQVEQLDALIATIQKQIEQKQGVYFNMLSADPDALVQFEELKGLYVDASGVKKELSAAKSIERAIAKLNELKRRFERESLRLAFIGRERQGKSTFLKTITGLSDKVIPAYSGNSCTGAVSVIHNVENVIDHAGNPVKVKVVVQYYGAAEFINIVNEKLKKFFPEGSYHIGRLEQIRDLVLPETCNQSNKIEDEFEKFKISFVEHYYDYAYLLGEKVVTYYDEDVIAYHVAQYEEFSKPTSIMYPIMAPDGRLTAEERHSHKVKKNDDTIVDQIDYYKFVAVKNVDIYTKFQVETTKKLELVDTIGIGSSADSASIKEEMFRVLKEDCDGAINLYRPDFTSNWPAEQPELLDEIAIKLADRAPEKWIVYVINKITSGIFVNAQSALNILERISKRNCKGIAWSKAIDGVNFEDVKDNLVSPLLTLIANNLDWLDESLTLDAESLMKEAYNDCLSLVKSANSVTSAGNGLSSDALSLFDEKLFKDLLKSFGYEMNQIDQKGYATKRDKECFQLEDAYMNIINDIDVYIPDEDAILERFETGAFLTQDRLFQDYVEQMRNDIYTAFEDVNTEVMHPLQEKVKTDLIEILYNQGLLKNLPTSCEMASIEWLQEVIDNYVDETFYPNFRKALQFILDYQINIEGLVEYNVTKSLYILDPTHSEFLPYKGKFTEDFEQKASDVWQELCNRLPHVQKRLKEWIRSFALIPSHSFYSRVHKFHVKVMTDREGMEDFRRFYRKNMALIWAAEINAACHSEKAFGEWTERIKNLQRVVTSDNFKIS